VLEHLLLARRVDAPEILDEGTASESETHRSLEDLRRLNRWLFGVDAMSRIVQGWLREQPEATIVLDVGTGSGQMAQAIVRLAARERRPVSVLALDFSPLHLESARAWNARGGIGTVHLLAADALRLPLANHSVDYVISSLFVHHFDERSLAVLFKECRRVARRGLLMSDLWRHPLPFYLYKALAEPLFVRSRVTRADSTVSFRRSYRPGEIRQIAMRSLPDARVSLHLPSLRWLLASQWD
jgi:SAM-dependent methyltransferase